MSLSFILNFYLYRLCCRPCGPKEGYCLSEPVGAAAPTPRGRGVSPPGASDFFDAEKVTKKAPGTPRSPIFFLIGLYQWGNSSAPESGFCHLIYSGSIDDASAAALLKGEMFLLVLVETWFLKCNLGSIRRRIGYLKVLRRGDPMGGVPPLCRCGWGIFKGEGESKHPPG